MYGGKDVECGGVGTGPKASALHKNVFRFAIE